MCKRITERSSYSKEELEGCIGEFLLKIVNVLEKGNIVQMGDLGNFRMSLKTGIPTVTEKEFKASCILKLIAIYKNERQYIYCLSFFYINDLRRQLIRGKFIPAFKPP